MSSKWKRATAHQSRSRHQRQTRPAPGTSTQPRDRPRSRTAARGGNFDDRHGQRVSRYSTSDALLQSAPRSRSRRSRRETRLIRLNALKFRACEGTYSRALRPATCPARSRRWNPTDELDQVYEALVFWADVVVFATPIRWGNASSLYYKMIERIELRSESDHDCRPRADPHKVASFIITGGQDNIQRSPGRC